MSRWLQQIHAILGSKSNELISKNSDKRVSSGLSDMLAPGALGGLAGLLISSKSSRKLLSRYGKNALVVGGGAAAGIFLWKKYQQRMGESAQPAVPSVSSVPVTAPVERRAERLIQALVFAAKSGGHIDDKERQAIDEHLQSAGLGAECERLVREAIAMPLDPEKLAGDINDPQEALELYFLSNLVIDVDHFMERSYLQALGDALNIPADVRESIAQDIMAEKMKIAN
ncbi:MAG: Inner membrane protein YebE [Candidatus Erwinia impunctatus]|nr:Inner membrane protein YebE [Culicoides impunctatus]